MIEPETRRGRPPRAHTNDTPPWAQRLRYLRETAGLSIGDLADRTGLGTAALGRYDSGQRTPDVFAGLALARALGCSVEQIFG